MRAVLGLVLLLQGCTIIPKDDLVKFDCDNYRCEVRTNILICNEENTHCEYIDVPIVESE